MNLIILDHFGSLMGASFVKGGWVRLGWQTAGFVPISPDPVKAADLLCLGMPCRSHSSDCSHMLGCIAGHLLLP